jgi:competence protein ComEC
MNHFNKISISFLIIILYVLIVTPVTADGYGVLDPGTSGTANVMSLSSGYVDNNVMNTLPSVDNDGNVINPSSDNLGNVMNTLPSVDSNGNVINPTSDNLGNVVNTLPSEKKTGSGLDDLKVYYLNTSHGDATLLESSGHFMMIDTGDTEDSSVVIDYLTKSGVKTLDYVIATNLNESAIGGITDLMEAFPVSVFSGPDNSFFSPTNEKINAMMKDKAIGYQQAVPGESLPFGDASITFLNRSTSAINASDNAMSVLIGTGSVTFLFTGNQNLGPTPATIWAVPNQGGEGSLASLSDISPQVLIINPEAKETYNATLDTLTKLKIDPFLTNVDGTIVVSTDGNDYHVSSGSGKTFQKPVPEDISTLEVTPVTNINSNESRLQNGVASTSVI